MAVDKLVDSEKLDADLTSVANAIRGQTNTTGDLSFPDGFVSSINSIDKSLGITEATVGQIAKITAVDTNGRPTAWEAVECIETKSWNYVHFSVSTEEEQTNQFVISTTEKLNEILVKGAVLFDSYDGFLIQLPPGTGGGYNILKSPPNYSQTNKYFGIYGKRIRDMFIGCGGCSQWGPNNIDAYFTNIIPPQRTIEHLDGNNIAFGSMWFNKTMLVGTDFEVWWR